MCWCRLPAPQGASESARVRAFRSLPRLGWVPCVRGRHTPRSPWQTTCRRRPRASAPRFPRGWRCRELSPVLPSRLRIFSDDTSTRIVCSSLKKIKLHIFRHSHAILRNNSRRSRAPFTGPPWRHVLTCRRVTARSWPLGRLPHTTLRSPRTLGAGIFRATPTPPPIPPEFLETTISFSVS